MFVRRAPDIRSSEITPEGVYLNRRSFLGIAAGTGLVAAAGLLSPALLRRGDASAAGLLDGAARQDDELTPYDTVTSYNNFYEFGTGKEDPAENAHTLQPRPWTLTIDGEVSKPGVYELDDFLKPYAIEDRTYRLRCVEAWSMVIPWQGVPLGEVLRRAQPTGKARFVEFTTLYDPQQMPGQRTGVLPWPYREALRLDEAAHPLTLLATGLYGNPMPNQNGAPLRLVVPWKYGFKSIKSIVRIRVTEQRPATTWNLAAPNEYGFYANVNPAVDHPRWSQARERRIGDWRRRPTLPFNGYADQVARLYTGLDLKSNF